MEGAHTYYIEWWTIGDKIRTPEPGTFTMRPKSLVYFLRRLTNTKRNVVFLRDMSTNSVILDRKNTC